MFYVLIIVAKYLSRNISPVKAPVSGLWECPLISCSLALGITKMEHSGRSKGKELHLVILICSFLVISEIVFLCVYRLFLFFC